MELVRGVSITENCDRNKLNTQERLELFVPICNAVHHAHQKGVHRDIKPSNIMVTLHDGKPVPRVIVLYELLTGALPFDEEGLLQARHPQ